uniref:Uncharacterized protein n=1 Tax=viral metagenome TaxID=1070528 RepID=A0A6H1ZYQ1_9ZZZZ
MVLIRVYVDGSQYGQCDARCYNAKGTACTCCCMGSNHGLGLIAALASTRQLFAHRRKDDPFFDPLRDLGDDVYFEAEVPFSGFVDITPGRATP